MNNTKKSLKVLFIGESWHIHMIHSKGYDSFTLDLPLYFQTPVIT